MAETANLPTRAEVRKFSDLMKDANAPFGAILQHPEMMRRMMQAVPKHLSPDRMIRVCALAMQKTPKLAEVDRGTMLGALLTCASLGLEPNTVLGHCYLIPFGKTCQLILGYKGLADLARRSGKVGHLHADVVFPGDEFDYWYGKGADLRHRPKGARNGQWTYAYAIAEIIGGGWQFEVMTYEEVMAIRNKSQGYIQALKETNPVKRQKAPWIGYEAEMAKKTALRRLSKLLPMSIEYASAAALDEMSDTGRQDFSSLADATDIQWAIEGSLSDVEDATETAPPSAGAATPPVQRTAEKVAAQPSTSQPAEPPAHVTEPIPEETQPLSMYQSIVAGIDASNSVSELQAWWDHCREKDDAGQTIVDALTPDERADAIGHKLRREGVLISAERPRR